MRAVLGLLGAIVLAGGAALGALWLLEERIIFHPSREIFATPGSVGLAYEDVRIPTSDGETIAGWWIPAGPGATTILFLHGNAGNLSHRLDTVEALHREGFGVLIVDYRGYGESSGAPTEQGIYRDARAAWDHLVGARGLPPPRIVIYGESIGSAPALRLAADLRAGGLPGPRGLVLEGAFTSGAEMGRRILPFLPVGWVARTRMDNLAAVREIAAPVLFVHAGLDEIVPIAMGRRLHEASASSLKLFVEVPGARHNTVWALASKAVAGAVREFAARAEPS